MLFRSAPFCSVNGKKYSMKYERNIDSIINDGGGDSRCNQNFNNRLTRNMHSMQYTGLRVCPLSIARLTFLIRIFRSQKSEVSYDTVQVGTVQVYTCSTICLHPFYTALQYDTRSTSFLTSVLIRPFYPLDSENAPAANHERP